MKLQYIAKVGISTIIALSYVLCCVPITIAATPEFRLVPDRGLCMDSAQLVRVQSANFTPGMTIVIMMTYPYQGGPTMSTTVQAHWLVRPDGTLPDAIYVGCASTTPDGSIITFNAYEELAPPLGPQNLGEQKLATATFTVDRSAGPLPGLPNTGQGGGAQPSLGLAQLLALALIGTGIGSYARWRKSSRAGCPR